MSAVRKASKKATNLALEPTSDIHILTVPTLTSCYTIHDPRGNAISYSKLGPALDMATELAEELQEAIDVCNSYGTIVAITPKQRRKTP